MSLTVQFYTMLSMVGMGSLFGAMFDTYQRFLNRPNRKSWIVFFNDVLFWMVQALLIFYVLFLMNNGEIRFYIFLALLCGFAAYQSLIKRIYLRILEFAILTVISVWQFLKQTFRMVIYQPAVGLIRFMILIILFLGRGLLSLVKFAFKVVLFVVKNLVLFPLKKILIIIWKLLPKSLKKNVEKLYNRTAGFFKAIKNSLINLYTKLKRKKE